MPQQIRLTMHEGRSEFPRGCRGASVCSVILSGQVCSLTEILWLDGQSGVQERILARSAASARIQSGCGSEENTKHTFDEQQVKGLGVRLSPDPLR